MKFTIFPLHCKGPILKTKFWAERTVVLRSSAPALGKLLIAKVYQEQYQKSANYQFFLNRL